MKQLALTHSIANRLYSASVMPQSAWRHQAQGLLPREIRQLRVRAMQAMCTKTKGRCVTTMLALGYPEGADPGVMVRQEQGIAWQALWKAQDQQARKKVRLAWKNKRLHMEEAKFRW